MLKKLVKYGNSNALILDKAILELLNIKEGSTIKIKTDGTSIIITPHDMAHAQKISETFTHNKATIEAAVKESLKRDSNGTNSSQEKKESALKALLAKHQELHAQLTQNPNFFKDTIALKEKMNPASPEFIDAYRALRAQHSPEIIHLEEAIAGFERTKLNKKEAQAMESTLTAHFKKHQALQLAYGNLLNNPDYQHKAQLIAEQFQDTKNTAQYLHELDELTYNFLPEMRAANKELQAILKKYNQ